MQTVSENGNVWKCLAERDSSGIKLGWSRSKEEKVSIEVEIDWHAA